MNYNKMMKMLVVSSSLFASSLIQAAPKEDDSQQRMLYEKILRCTHRIIDMNLVSMDDETINSVTIASHFMSDMLTFKDSPDSLQETLNTCLDKKSELKPFVTKVNLWQRIKNKFKKKSRVETQESLKDESVQEQIAHTGYKENPDGSSLDLIQKTLDSFPTDVNAKVKDYFAMMVSPQGLNCTLGGLQGMAGLIVAEVKVGLHLGLCTSLSGRIYPIAAESMGGGILTFGGHGLGAILSGTKLSFKMSERDYIGMITRETGDAALGVGVALDFDDPKVKNKEKGRVTGVSVGLGKFYNKEVVFFPQKVSPPLPKIRKFNYALKTLGLI